MVCESTKGERNNGLLIHGPAKLGKTQYVKWKAGEMMVYMKGLMDWDKWDENPDPSYLIIDDMNPLWIREWRKMLLGEDEFHVNPKYGKLKEMKPLPTICIVNDLWEFDDWDSVNWDIVEVEDSLF